MSRINLNHAKQAYNVISSWLGEGGKPVTKEVAEARAEVCLGCPKNVRTWAIVDFAKWTSAVAFRRQIATKNKMNLRLNMESEIGVCKACGCALQLKLWVPMKFVKENLDQETIKQMPANCWQLQETKE